MVLSNGYLISIFKLEYKNQNQIVFCAIKRALDFEYTNGVLLHAQNVNSVEIPCATSCISLERNGEMRPYRRPFDASKP